VCRVSGAHCTSSSGYTPVGSGSRHWPAVFSTHGWPSRSVTTVPGRHASTSASVLSIGAGGRHPRGHDLPTVRATARPQARGADPVVTGRLRRGPPGQLPGQQPGQGPPVPLLDGSADDGVGGTAGAGRSLLVAHPGLPSPPLSTIGFTVRSLTRNPARVPSPLARTP
jgi:hypothetical protein